MLENQITRRGWKVVMERGGIQKDFSCGFPSQKAAMEYAEMLNWCYTDYNGVDCSLAVAPDVREMIQARDGIFQNVKW